MARYSVDRAITTCIRRYELILVEAASPEAAAAQVATGQYTDEDVFPYDAHPLPDADSYVAGVHLIIPTVAS